jgi:N-acetylmuramoyl-L-alanine amidase
MIDFLLKSSASLLVFLTFYHLVLETEKMHRFNRFYLLATIVISFVIPFLSFEITKIIPTIASAETINESVIPAVTNRPSLPETVVVITEKINYVSILLWSLYGWITSILFFRFGKNIFQLNQKVKSHDNLTCNNAILVLVNEKSLPYSFMNYVFVNKNDYQTQEIEDELFTHELVHVNQKHSIDILLIEFLKCIFWFNPLFYFYKKAIQLNHEFLADEKVIASYNNVTYYQNLLLLKSSNLKTISLTSNFNFSITKKRLVMMTKKTSKKINFIKKIAIVPVVSFLIYFFCIQMVAREKTIFQDKNIKAQSQILKDSNSNNSVKNLNSISIETENILQNTVLSPYSENNKKTIVIDAGHGGHDFGTQIDGELESKIVESIAKKIKLLNSKNEIEIILLRDNDTFIGLKERVDAINKINPDLLISLHVNSSNNKEENGAIAYIFSENAFYKKSIKSAEILKNTFNKGEVKNGNFFIIKNSNCPAVLLELGYLSNENDKEYLTSEIGKNEIANKIFNYLNK